jgi:hypothetical protein
MQQSEKIRENVKKFCNSIHCLDHSLASIVSRVCRVQGLSVHLIFRSQTKTVLRSRNIFEYLWLKGVKVLEQLRASTPHL